MQKMTTYLWFENQAEEAARFYTQTFKGGKLGGISHYNTDSAEVSGQPEGSVLSVAFELFGQSFGALNGGPMFKLTPAISFLVHCEDQAEIDRLWETLGQGGAHMECGWVTDKYGVTWQIAPANLHDLLNHPDPAKADKAMQAMLKMTKLDIAALEDAVK